MTEQRALRKLRLILVALASLSTVIAFSITSDTVFRLTGSVNEPSSIVTLVGITFTTIVLVFLYYKQSHILKEQSQIADFHSEDVFKLQHDGSELIIQTDDSIDESGLSQIIHDYERAEVIERRDTADGVEFVLRNPERSEQ